jgi:hypothetical protein
LQVRAGSIESGRAEGVGRQFERRVCLPCGIALCFESLPQANEARDLAASRSRCDAGTVHPVVVNSGPTTLEFIVSLVIVGILGPTLGVFAARWADRRRFAHERKLKASDDLVARIDDVAESLDRLCEVCSIMRMTAVLRGPESVDTLEAISEAEHAHIRTRALNSRLAMRPHADPALLESAVAAAMSMNSGIENIRNANVRRRAAVKAAGQPIVLGVYDDERVESLLNSGLEHIKEFEARARATIGMLLDEPSRRHGRLRKRRAPR